MTVNRIRVQKKRRRLMMGDDWWEPSTRKERRFSALSAISTESFSRVNKYLWYTWREYIQNSSDHGRQGDFFGGLEAQATDIALMDGQSTCLHIFPSLWSSWVMVLPLLGRFLLALSHSKIDMWEANDAHTLWCVGIVGRFRKFAKVQKNQRTSMKINQNFTYIDKKQTKVSKK